MYFVVQRVQAHSIKKQHDVIEDRESLGIKIDRDKLVEDCMLKKTHQRFDKYKDI